MEDTLSYLLRNFGMKYRHYVYNLLGKDRWGVSQDLAIYHIAQKQKAQPKGPCQQIEHYTRFSLGHRPSNGISGTAD